MPNIKIVSIVDDDDAVRTATQTFIRSLGYKAVAFASAEDFLASERLHDTACLILDVNLPGMSGFELQSQLNSEQRAIPIIFITAHADDASRQRALKSGAIDFLGKPVRCEPLFRAIQSALEL